MQSWTWVIAIFAQFCALAVFPEARASRRWRVVPVVLLLAAVALMVSFALAPASHHGYVAASPAAAAEVELHASGLAGYGIPLSALVAAQAASRCRSSGSGAATRVLRQLGWYAYGNAITLG